MKIIFMTITFLGAMSAYATITTRIAKVYPPDQYNSNHEVLAYYDGRVFEASPDSPEIIETLLEAQKNGSSLEIELADAPLIFNPDAPELIIDARPVDETQEELPEQEFETEQAIFQSVYDYEPTNVESMELAGKMFDHLSPRTQRKTECFNRAHIWNRQLHKDYKVNSEKIFIFYTRKYRREIRWKWWFHTAPLIRVNDEAIVLDREYTVSPVKEESWEWQFSKPKRDRDIDCKRIDRMSEYYDRYNTNNVYCNIHIAPMYYWEPSRLQKLENRGIKQERWINWEIRHAARDVYSRWVDVFNRYRID